MPSIKQSDLDAWKEQISLLTAMNNELHAEAAQFQSRVRAFDAILNKIGRAAKGQPIAERRPGGGYDDFGSGSPFPPFATAEVRPYKPTEAERATMRAEKAEAQLSEAEKRIAAVLALAAFAKDHKA